MNVTAYRILKKLVELHPEEYTWAEDVIKVFGTKNQMREIAWAVLPSKILGPLPVDQYRYPPEYSKTMTIYKKYGSEGVALYLKETDYRERMAVYNNLIRGDAVTTYKLITGLEPTNEAMSIMHEWTKLKSGKDLFIKGLGTFDIRSTVQRLLTIRAGRYLGTAISPTDLTLMGYFDSTDWSLRSIVTGKQSKVLAHIVRFRKQWTTELLGRIDELTRLLTMEPEFIESAAFNSPPTRLLELANERRIKIHEENEILRKDMSKFKPVDIPAVTFEEGYTLRIAESPEELIAIAHVLSICTDDPHYSVKMRLGKIQIWGLYKDKTLVGVGELSKKGEWSQLRGNRNGILRDEEIQLFNQAITIITN